VAATRTTLLFVVLTCTLVGKLLALGVTLDTASHPQQRSVLPATLALLGFLFAPLPWLRPSVRAAAFFAFDLLITTLAVADAIHFRVLGDVVSIAELTHASQLGFVMPGVASLLKRRDLLPFLDVAIGILLYTFWARRGDHGDSPTPLRLKQSIALLVTALLLSIAPIRLMRLDPEEVFAYSTTRREVAVAIGLLPFHAYDLGAHLFYPISGRLAVDDADRRRVGNFFDQRRAAMSEPSPAFGVAKGRNVILVMAESLERFPIGFALDGQPVAPSLARFASESLDFTNFFDQTNLGTTSDAEFASIQSLHPLPDAVVATRYPANDFHGLPAILAAHGYRSLSACGVTGDFWNMRQMHMNLGFASANFIDRFRPGEMFGMGLSDGEFFDQAGEMLGALDEPFVSFLITVSNHSPYRLPAEHRRLRLGRLEGTLLGNYLQSVHYFDDVFGRFVEGLRQSGLLERSVVVVYGDHRAFWDDVPELPRLFGFEEKDVYRVWEAERKLPLLIRLPNRELAGARDSAGGHLDIAPTILSLLGLPSAGEVLLGRDLLGSEMPLVAFRNGDFIAGRHSVTGLGSAGPLCRDLSTAQAIDCPQYPLERSMARERLEISDLIIRGNLIPYLRTAGRHRSADPR
jgi:phosphoglycerol transferase MdoB-like AlkP superfamily enzyme